MVEMALVPGGDARLAYAGDTFNTAVYLSRLGLTVGYVTALGAGDPFSAGILKRMADEGISAELVAEAPGRLPGLYAIERDEAGERRFFYWRGEAAARDLMVLADIPALTSAMQGARLVYLSGITLAVIGAAGRAQLGQMLAQARAAGADIAFDTNYRPRLWSDAEEARAAFEAVVPLATFVSTSAEDILDLYAEGPAVTADRWAGLGPEVIARAPGTGVSVHRAGSVFEAPDSAPLAVTDATGAGDSFNAAYLVTRLAGGTPAEGVAAGRRLAAMVVQHLGAIIPIDAMPVGRLV
jgi:2-dehydro-3-deoxygluconokinase